MWGWVYEVKGAQGVGVEGEHAVFVGVIYLG